MGLNNSRGLVEEDTTDEEKVLCRRRRNEATVHAVNIDRTVGPGWLTTTEINMGSWALVCTPRHRQSKWFPIAMSRFCEGQSVGGFEGLGIVVESLSSS